MYMCLVSYTFLINSINFIDSLAFWSRTLLRVVSIRMVGVGASF